MDSIRRYSTRHCSGRAALIALLLVAALAVGLGGGYMFRDMREKSQETAGGVSEEHEGHRTTQMKTLYTCGMHPEIVSDEPGTCPKCDMKLTPMDPDRARVILEARGESVPAGGAAKKDRKVLYWRAPMDPTYIRNEPGKSPMGMDLVPVYEDQVAGGPSIRIDPVTEQNMGLRYDVVRTGPLEKTIRTVGAVDYDEQGLGTVTTKIDGWVEKIHVDRTGVQVHKDEPLFEIYSPELVSTQRDYLVALRDLQNAESQNNPNMARMARDRLDSARGRLQLFDITDAQIEKLEKEEEVRKTLTITSLLTGIVTHKNVVQGDYVKAGSPTYKIADLSNVWVIGKVFESDVPYLQLGQEAQMELDYLPGRVYRGRVTYIYPYLEPGTREVPVRMEFHNPGYDLKPGMFATIKLQSKIADRAVLVPAMSVIDTGERKIAYVLREPGKFEPRRLTTGVRTDNDEIQVIHGLAPGEKVVASGQFLLDSESRLREATLKMLNPGMSNTAQTLDNTTSTMTGAHAGHVAPGERPELSTKWVCPMPSHAGILYDESGPCPLCKMKMVPAQPWQKAGGRIDHYTCPMPEHYDVHEENPGKCPQCGMTLIPVTEEDMARFEQVKPGEMPQALYTCPMPIHADVVSDKPGDCPKCGMKLVPTVSVPHGRQAEEQWHEDHPTSPTAAGPVLYTCPMESHAHIVSDKPGKCPECEMELVPTSTVPHGPKSEALWHQDHASSSPAESLTLYTCPMESHAHIVLDKPGKCPECNMTLVETSTVDHGPKSEALWMKDHPTSNSETPVLYTCPMATHAHIVTDKPGKCPECNMTLVETSTVEHREESEAIWRKQNSAKE